MSARRARWLLACFAAGAALVAAPHAHAAPSPDGTYLALLNAGGIGYGSADAAIIQGHAMCYDLDAGYAWPAVVNRVALDLPLTRGQAVTAVAAAVAAYCPWDSNQYAHAVV